MRGSSGRSPSARGPTTSSQAGPACVPIAAAVHSTGTSPPVHRPPRNGRTGITMARGPADGWLDPPRGHAMARAPCPSRSAACRGPQCRHARHNRRAARLGRCAAAGAAAPAPPRARADARMAKARPGRRHLERGRQGPPSTRQSPCSMRRTRRPCRASWHARAPTPAPPGSVPLPCR